jgi:hypothetical protein
VTNGTMPYTTAVQPHAAFTVPGTSFGGCAGPYCPKSSQYSVKRLCFASQHATVTLTTTVGKRSTYYDSELYLFRVADDIGPIRGKQVQYEPDFASFWAAPEPILQLYDDNSGSICSTPDAKGIDVCKGMYPATGPCSKTPAGIISCPAGSWRRLLSSVSFQLLREWQRPIICYYAAIAAIDAPADVSELSFGLSIQLTPPEPCAPGCAIPACIACMCATAGVRRPAHA